ncbi:Kinesin-like protein nack1 [Stylosanthes scabra]|uniref:Kinesin-like protein nack1 n=1 Tax=Stylosanthes scabra TaxID=79078 RepID=A0ABU6RKT5_9FABA|nr:Kinesin-like protein nack1 [Stylosanthes scabra]
MDIIEKAKAAGYAVTCLPENEEGPGEQEESQVSWHIPFMEQQQIIELLDLCFVSIIHRTQFYLSFKGDAADQIYMEVELRRLTWLQQHLAKVGNASPAHVGDEPISLTSSIKVLRRERKFLTKRLGYCLTLEERDAMYMKWDVPLVGKQKRM